MAFPCQVLRAVDKAQHVLLSEEGLVAVAVLWCSLPSRSMHLAFLFLTSCLVGADCPQPSPDCRRNARTGLVLGSLVLPTLFAVQAPMMDAISVAFRLTWWCGWMSMALRLWRCRVCRHVAAPLDSAVGVAMAFVFVCALRASGDAVLLPGVMVFAVCLTMVQKAMPRSFTIGEATVVAELCAVLFHVMLYSVILDIFPLVVLTSQLRRFIAIALFSAVGISAGNMFLSHTLSGGLARCSGALKSMFHLSFTLTSGMLMFVWMSYSIGENSLGWLWLYITSHTATPMKFLVYYVVVLIPALIFAPGSGGGQRRILLRKYFHVLALIMFVPTILVHIRFMALAFAGAIALFMVIESLRMSDVQPVAGILNPFFKAYLDERDEGAATLTHIYLLLGCALPVFFTYFVMRGIFSANGLLVALSGVAVTGLGDAVASYCGVHFGRHRWHQSKKTIEGTASMIAAVLAFQVICLCVVGFHNLSFSSWARLVLADVLVALLEAKTDQIDNMFLPLYHVALLQLV